MAQISLYKCAADLLLCFLHMQKGDALMVWLWVINLRHHAKMSVLCKPPTPHFYSKIGIYRVIDYFLIFALKHRLWVLIRPPQ